MENKTAMQLLIEDLGKLISDEQLTPIYRAGILSAQDRAKNSLEKEKTQIAQAWANGLNTERRGNHPYYSGQDYYNQTYNPNQQRIIEGL